MFAHYFTSNKKHFVIISVDARPVGEKVAVEGKKQARELAKARNCVCWNF
jgi:translation initiation factor 2B subunit (eIF-2B alpha/beta/delta family)